MKDARLVVLPFEYRGPIEMDHTAADFTRDLVASLNRYSAIDIDAEQTSEALGPWRPSGQKIAKKEAGYVVQGQVNFVAAGLSQERDHLQVSIRLLDHSKRDLLHSMSIERVFEDELPIGREIAEEVALELAASVQGHHNRHLSPSLLALEAYFRAISLWQRNGYSLELVENVESLLETATTEDPKLDLAWAALVRVRSMAYLNESRTFATHQSAADALGRAESLAPQSAHFLLASGYYHYHVLRDFVAARRYFDRALESSPSDAEVLAAIGYLLRRQGQLAESLGYLERAFDLDSRNARLASHIAETERARRDYGSAEDWFAVTIRLSPDIYYAFGERAENLLALRQCGEVWSRPKCAADEARNVLESATAGTRGLWTARVHIAALEFGSGGPPEKFLAVFDSRAEPEINSGMAARFAWRKVTVLLELGQEAEALALSRQATVELEVESATRRRPRDGAALRLLAALGGHREGPASMSLEAFYDYARQDPFSGPRALKWIAITHAVLGEYDQAVDILRELSRVDYQHSLASYELHADPVWAPLREAGLLDDIWFELRDRERRVEAQSRRDTWDRLGSLTGPRTIGRRTALDGDRRP